MTLNKRIDVLIDERERQCCELLSLSLSLTSFTLLSHHDSRCVVPVRLAVAEYISAEADAAVEFADGMDEDTVALLDGCCPGSDHDLDNKAGYVLRQLPQIHDDVDYCAHCIVMVMVSPLSCAWMR